MISITTRQAVESQEALRGILASPLPLDAARSVARAWRGVSEAAKGFDAARFAALTAHAVTDANGQPIPAEQPGHVLLRDEQAFSAAVDELLAAPVTIDAEPIALATMPGLVIAPAVLLEVDWLFEG